MGRGQDSREFDTEMEVGVHTTVGRVIDPGVTLALLTRGCFPGLETSRDSRCRSVHGSKDTVLEAAFRSG